MKMYECQRSSWSDLSEDKYGPSGKLKYTILLHMSVSKISRDNNIRVIDGMHEAFNSFPRSPVFTYVYWYRLIESTKLLLSQTVMS